MTVTFRVATLNDITAIQEVGRASRHRAYVSTGLVDVEENERVLTDAWSAEMLTISMTNRSNHAIVAEAGERVVGYLSGRCRNPLDVGQVRLYRIYLHPDYWGRQVGYQMWQNYFDALATDVKRVDVGVLAGNKQAMSFYQRLGFTIVMTKDDKHQLQLRL